MASPIAYDREPRQEHVYSHYAIRTEDRPRFTMEDRVPEHNIAGNSKDYAKGRKSPQIGRPKKSGT